MNIDFFCYFIVLVFVILATRKSRPSRVISNKESQARNKHLEEIYNKYKNFIDAKQGMTNKEKRIRIHLVGKLEERGWINPNMSNEEIGEVYSKFEEGWYLL